MTLGHSWYTSTGLCHHGGCRCPEARLAPDHQHQPLCYLHTDSNGWSVTLPYMDVLFQLLTHWDQITHIYVDNLTITSSDNGLSPGRCQAIIWTNAGILLFGPLGTNFSEISIKIQAFSLKKIHLKMSSAKRCSFRLGLNVLNIQCLKKDWR